jgi:single-strand DNA-binding protein
VLNRVVLIGRLTRDPELKYTSTGNAVCSFTLAVERDFKGQDGQKQTDFIRVKVWRKLAEVVAQHSGKGRLVAVEGRIEVRNYEAQDGSKRTSTEVIADNIRFLDWPKEQGGGEQLAQDVQDVFGGVDENNDFPF